jgi:hypothetical protein
MRKVKRLPPIMFPVWATVFLADKAVQFVLWLFGKWNCKDCGKRYGIYDERFEVIYIKTIYKKGQQYHKYKAKKICTACYRKQQHEEEKES